MISDSFTDHRSGSQPCLVSLHTFEPRKKWLNFRQSTTSLDKKHNMTIKDSYKFIDPEENGTDKYQRHLKPVPCHLHVHVTAPFMCPTEPLIVSVSILRLCLVLPVMSISLSPTDGGSEYLQEKWFLSGCCTPPFVSSQPTPWRNQYFYSHSRSSLHCQFNWCAWEWVSAIH